MNIYTKYIIEAVHDYNILFTGCGMTTEEVKAFLLKHLPAHIVRWSRMDDVDWVLVTERFKNHER